MTSASKKLLSHKQGVLLRKDSRPVIPHFFEGPEKLLEIIFRSNTPNSSHDTPYLGLRIIPRSVWEDVLKLVKCEVLSVIKNDYMDAYMLSESSLFVFPTKILLKTCGTTTLLHALQRILDVAYEYCGLIECNNVFYSRKNFMKPQKQIYPHTSFPDESVVLDKYFDGAAYTLGRLNDGDHWNLYIYENANINLECVPTDTTLEILMHDLHPDAASQFYRDDDFISSRHCSKSVGIMDLMPGATVDDLVFDPCGYSANGILDESYFTIHVTPQTECSYASFETNIVLNDYTDLINKVLKVFRPGRFTLTFFTNDYMQNSCETPGPISPMPVENERFVGYQKKNKIIYEFETYQLYFGYYSKIPN